MEKLKKLIKNCSKNAKLSCKECKTDSKTCIDYILRENFKQCEYCDTILFDKKGKKLPKLYCQMCGRPLNLI